MFLLTEDTLSIRYFTKCIDADGLISIESVKKQFNPFEEANLDEPVIQEDKVDSPQAVNEASHLLEQLE